MALAENLLPILHKLRGIRGKLGFAPFTLKVIKETYTGEYGSEVLGTATEKTLANDGYQSLKIKFVNQNNYWSGIPQDAEISIVLTPNQTCTISDLTVDNDPPNTRVYFILNGEGFENCTMQLVKLDTEKKLKWILYLKRAANEQ